ncbi:MAG: hypothetical protein WD468_00310 [Pirellulales bacterium]
MFTRAPLVPFRHAPGEFVEVNATSIGVGPMNNSEDWQHTRVGSWVEAKAGDDVTVTTGPVPLGDWNEEPPLDGEPRWWLDFITARLRHALPLPADKAERERLLYHIALDLFGTPLSAEETAAFVADRAPTALDSLAKRLAHRSGLTPYTGSLQSGATKFRVLPADPDAAKKPRTASNPGEYTLGGNATLKVTRRPAGERIVNEASIQFSPSDATKPAPREPHKLKLPDGYDTWAAAWARGATVLWVLQKGSIGSYDFTNPAQVKETTLEETADVEKVPKPILDALRAALDVPGAPKQAPATPKKYGAEANAVEKLWIADRTWKYELCGTKGGQQILKAEPLNPKKPDDTVDCCHAAIDWLFEPCTERRKSRPGKGKAVRLVSRTA